jgi:hypothetical protein
MSKKILAVALAAAMILGLASVAFAASFSDTVDHEREIAVKQLAGLGLLNGYEDGTFRPDNPITRAEFAKVMVYALGLKDAAEMLAGVPVPFTDVEANHWATGYISIATSQEIVKGYPDGTFGPQNNVTYAEVLTMILRALGYGPILDKGPWPTAYITKAADLKLNKGISFLSNAPATRGDVAGLVANAVSTPKLVAIAWGPDGSPTQYGVSGSAPGTKLVTLLHDMGAEYVTGWLVDSPELFPNTTGEITLDDPRDADDAVVATPPTVLAEGTEFAGLIGRKVRAWLNDEGEVFFLEDITPASAIKTATRNGADSVKIDGKVVSVNGKEMFRNYQNPVVVDGTAGKAIVSGDTITVIYDGNAVKHVVAVGYDWGVVSSVNTKYSRITFTADRSATASITLDDYDVVWDGAADCLEDLEENDVLDYIWDSTNEKAIIIVTRSSATGAFTKLTGSAATIDGVDYGYLSGKAPSTLLGKDVTVLFNKNGKIVSMAQATTAPSAKTYGVVYAKSTADDDFGSPIRKLKVVDSTGTAGTFNVVSSQAPAYTAVDLGDVISYTLNDDGAINSLTIEIDYDAGGYASVPVDDDLLTVDNKRITSSTVVFDISAGVGEFDKGVGGNGAPTASNIKVVTTSVLLDVNPVVAAVKVDLGRAAVVASKTQLVASSSTGLGMYYGSYRTVVGSSRYWVLRILEEGVITDYVVKSGLDADKALTHADHYGADGLTKKVVSFTANADDEITAKPGIVTATDVSSDVYELRVTDIDVENGVITVKWFEPDGDPKDANEYYYWVDEDTLYYDVTGTNPVSLTLDEVGLWSKVSLYRSGSQVLVLVVHAD